MFRIPFVFQPRRVLPARVNTAARGLCGYVAGLLSTGVCHAQTSAGDGSAECIPGLGILASVLLVLTGGLLWMLMYQRARSHRAEENQRQHKALLATTQQLVCLLDTEGRVLTASVSALQLGSTTHVVGNYFWDTPWWNHSTTEQTRLREAIRQALAGQTARLEAQLTDGDGALRVIECTIGAVRAPDGHARYVLCEGRDITHQRQTEAQLRTGLDTAPIALCRVNREGVFTLATGAAVESLGLNAAKITGQSAFEVFKTSPALCEMLRRALSGETVQGILPLGSQWIDLRLTPTLANDGATSGVIMFASSATEIQEARLLHQQLATAVEQTTESVVFTDPQGRVRYVNPAFERTSGYALDEIAGRSLSLLKSGIHDDAFYRELWSTILAGRTWRGRFKNRRKDGTLFTEEVVITPILDDQHRAQCFVSVGRDLTKNQAMEAALGRAQRPEVIEKLATGMAHDFNNLIQVVLANVSFARDQEATPSELAEYLGQIEQAANRGIHITRQLYTYCRKQTLHLADIDPSPALQEALPRLAARVGPTSPIDLVPASQPVTIRADAAQIEQVVGNLCLNARNAMPTGGRIALAIESTSLSQEDIPAGLTLRPGPYVCISVADTGCGIANDIRPKIFDPFFTTKPAGPGTGLGLASVQGIVQQHGGFVRVESQPGKGSTFRVLLPAVGNTRSDAPSARPPATAAQPASPAPAPSSPSALILLADDDESVRRITHAFLKRNGYQVLLAANGIEAGQVANQHMPQLAVLDALMPEMGGIEAARHLREKYPEIPIILASGMVHDATTNDIPGPPLALLGKPYSSEELLKLVRHMLRPVHPTNA